ncbi:MAG: Rieske 2Fe-2S domain-containing protein [Planctomycetaceae bacterium]|nr:Rieske 2Fe-2S domain-containing protein [Planctomycetaceae bacterium]MCB9951693.1 Rieske 2Fe-2S domain-containing protein [Planctomycetaceae bacterium]
MWHSLGPVDSFPNNEGRECTVADRIVAVFRQENEFRAIDGICAHAGGPLAKGTLQGGIVTCPWHGWQYDITTGQHCLTPQICQQSFPCKVEDDQLWVEL